MNDRYNGKKLGLWVGIALAAVFIIWGETIANRFGWQYPEWLRSFTGFAEVVIGLLLIVSAIFSLWGTGRKQK